jgi:hypothetical protein
MSEEDMSGIFQGIDLNSCDSEFDSDENSSSMPAEQKVPWLQSKRPEEIESLLLAEEQR